MSRTSRLTDVDFWLRRQPERDSISLPEGGTWRYHREVDPHLPDGEGRTALEVGVVPGNLLLYLATEHGYDPVGIDFSPRIHEVEEEFNAQGVEGEFVEADFLEWEPDRRFDLVSSFGFVEHFEEPESVIERHWELVRPGGLLLLTLPVFTPFQRFVRKMAYTGAMWEEIRETHNFDIMELKAIENAVRDLPDAGILEARHAEAINVWFSHAHSGVKTATAPFFFLFRPLEYIVRRLEWSSPLFSPKALVLARKEPDADSPR